MNNQPTPQNSEVEPTIKPVDMNEALAILETSGFKLLDSDVTLAQATPSKPNTWPPEAPLFHNDSIRRRAFAHRSCFLERPGRDKTSNPTPQDMNEVLEFLGDSILRAVVSTSVARGFPELHEGALSRITNCLTGTKVLVALAKIYRLDQHVRLGPGAEGAGARHRSNVLEDTFEALFGGLWEAHGWLITDWLWKLLEPILDGNEDSASSSAPNPTHTKKSALIGNVEVTSKALATPAEQNACSSNPPISLKRTANDANESPTTKKLQH